MRTLTVVTAHMHRPAQRLLRELEEKDQYPRIALYQQVLRSDMLNEEFLSEISGFRKVLYKFLPINISQVIEAFGRRNQYDVVVCWAENLGIPFAFLKKLSGSKVICVGIFSWISRPKKAWLLRALHSQFDKIVLMSTVQRDFALNHLGIPPYQVAFLRWPVDQNFWRPIKNETTMICSVGREMRDYDCLIKALQGTGIHCHIAAGGITTGKKDHWMDGAIDWSSLPANVTFGMKTPSELRDLYARSKFVVVPLLPTDTDNGSTTILEAMAMGKAVVASRVAGQRDIVRQDVNGVLVPPRDVKALRDAIVHLWNHPEIAEQMGMEGRRFIEQHHTLDAFVGNLKTVVNELMEMRNGTIYRSPTPLSHRRSSLKVLTVVTPGLSRPPENILRGLEYLDKYPRIFVYEDTLNSDILNESYVLKAPIVRKILYAFLPKVISFALEAFFVRKRYDVIITWSGQVGLPYGLLLKLTRARSPVHIMIMTWLSKNKKAAVLRFVSETVDRLILWSSVQKEIAIDRLGFPEHKIALVGRRVDPFFWRPMETPADIVCSAGQEMRDYITLIEALRGLDIPCYIATGALRGKLYETVKVIYEVEDIPANVFFLRLEYQEMRDLYARSRFVIVPLHQSDTDNGATVIEEAMAMGKAVICTRTVGQVDLLQDGKTGIYVEPGNILDMRNAIISLWNDPELARKMGEQGRAFIQRGHTLDHFVDSVQEIVENTFKQKRQKRN